MQSPATDGKPFKLPRNEQATDACITVNQIRGPSGETVTITIVKPREDYALDLPQAPPPRRSSKRAQRARERHWSR